MDKSESYLNLTASTDNQYVILQPPNILSGTEKSPSEMNCKRELAWPIWVLRSQELCDSQQNYKGSLTSMLLWLKEMDNRRTFLV